MQGRKRGRRVAGFAIAAGFTVLCVAAIAFRDLALEGYYLWKLKSGEPEGRALAGGKLGELRSVRAVPYLVNELASRAGREFGFGGKQSKEKLWPYRSLLAIGERCIPALIRTARDRDQGLERRAWALYALADINPDLQSHDVLAVCVACRADEQQGIRMFAESYLFRAGLLDQLVRGTEDEREAAFRNLRFMGEPLPAEMNFLIAKLDDANPAVRAALARVLGDMGSHSRRAIPALLGLKGDASEEVRKAASLALERIPR